MRNLFFFIFSFAICDAVYSSDISGVPLENGYDIAFNNMKALNNIATRKLNGMLSYSVKKIKFTVVGTESEYPPIDVNAKVSYYSVIVEDRQLVFNYLLSIGVNKKYIQEIIDVISTGAIHNKDCEGERSTCIVMNDTLKFVNDYYGGNLRVFLPSNYLSIEKSEPAFIDPNASANQLVSNIYANYDGNTSAQDNFFLTADNYLGLGVGYVNLNGILSSNSEFLNSLEYISDFNKYTFSLGFTGQDNGFYPAKGNSVFLDDDFVGVTFGKTNNLLVNDGSSRSLSFFSPSSGTVEIYRNNGIIYQGYIGSGYQSIPYTSLPLGNYDVDITVKNNGNIVFNGKGLVSNFNRTTNYEFMPYFRAGMLRLRNGTPADYVNKGLFEIGASYPLVGGLNAVVNGYFVDSNAFYTIGFDYQGERLYSNIKYTKSDGFYQAKLSIGYSYFNFQLTDGSYNVKSVSEFKNINEFISFRNHDYYIPSYSRLQASLSTNIPVTNNYSIYGNGFYFKDRQDKLSSYSYSLGGSYRSSKNINISMDYTIQNKDNKIGVNVIIPLWDELSYSSSLSLSKNKQINNFLNYSKRLSDTTSVSLMAGYNYNKDRDGTSDSYSSISGTLSQYNDYYSASVRAGKNNYNANYGFTFSSTPIFNSEGVYFTSKNNVKSSILIKNKEKTGDSIGDIQLFDKGQKKYNQYSIDDETMIYLDGYKQQRIKYQFNADGYFFVDASFNNNSVIDLSPGRVKIIDIDVVKSSQVLVITPKLNVDNISCDGNGCLSVEEIQKGIFKVIVKPDVNTKVYVGGELCWSGVLVQEKNAVALCGD